jgi:hypothetical protein
MALGALVVLGRHAKTLRMSLSTRLGVAVPPFQKVPACCCVEGGDAANLEVEVETGDRRTHLFESRCWVKIHRLAWNTPVEASADVVGKPLHVPRPGSGQGTWVRGAVGDEERSSGATASCGPGSRRNILSDVFGTFTRNEWRYYMANAKVPYVMAYGNISKALDGIKRASTPDRFTQDFLSTKLGMKGGSPKPVIPFLKRTGFLNTDGSPTARYKRFRNEAQSGAAAAEALRTGFSPLYEVNEYAHELSDKELKGVVVQVTGMEDANSAVSAIVGSFKALKAYADFEAVPTDDREAEVDPEPDRRLREDPVPRRADREALPTRLNLGYTINLQLPPTSDIAVFNAIFKSLREHLLDS